MERSVPHKVCELWVDLSKASLTLLGDVISCQLQYASRLTQSGYDTAAAHQPSLKRHFAPREPITNW